jgi:WhiB family transcriptional regulator, redox-sensing transcriptional regulator
MTVALLERIGDSGIEHEDLSWMGKGHCQGQVALFFPPLAERPDSRLRREAAAKSICAECPVQVACRTFGRVNHEYGVWGGENEEERVQAGYRLNAPVGVRKRTTVHLNLTSA